ncbi:outer membrane lipoprotein-sorting protein [Methylicorpusculum oleiharenae]|uniref:outer membrane lipoprotein-sorting protein n=1 Tax=Methylicorpusculum oleiharenae TaxID=1338687 RepID=UPI00135BA5DF|nr:outer membrane lipoprotein-sorting protein [Methylicorpusculum oleiharenae]MCD2451453.1 outer membrane lipoprotein-sorting protein [Methylicorpusculum oleiharenae]
MFLRLQLLLALIVAQPLITTPVSAEGANSPKPDATELLAKADGYRNFKGQSFTFDLKLNSIEPGKDDQIFTLKVEILNPHTSLVIYNEPVSERGKALLMAEKNLWFHSPSSHKPIRITPQQRLLGEAANGDVASTDFSGDYDPEYLGAETVDAIPCHVLELKAKADSLATYDKLKLWLRADDFKPYKADFFAASGKLLKTAYYKRYEKQPGQGNKEQLTSIQIINPLAEGKQTLMEYSNFKVVELPASRFSANALKRL